MSPGSLTSVWVEDVLSEAQVPDVLQNKEAIIFILITGEYFSMTTDLKVLLVFQAEKSQF